MNTSTSQHKNGRIIKTRTKDKKILVYTQLVQGIINQGTIYSVWQRENTIEYSIITAYIWNIIITDYMLIQRGPVLETHH